MYIRRKCVEPGWRWKERTATTKRSEKKQKEVGDGGRIYTRIGEDGIGEDGSELGPCLRAMETEGKATWSKKVL